MAPTTLHDLAPESLFAGRFRVGEALARGGMGAVYRVEQLSNGKPRALKVLHPELARDARFREKFAQEARVGARLTSAHVVEVSDAGIDDATGIPWLAMELPQGELVSAYVTPKLPLAAGDAWEILAPLGDALGAAHDVGVIHLDLKPENLFMARVAMRGVTRPVLKVLDFGIARVVLEGRTSAEVTTAAGSPLWMAPEQALEGGRVRSSSDVWSVGLLAFWLLTGKKYWREANARVPCCESSSPRCSFNRSSQRVSGRASWGSMGVSRRASTCGSGTRSNATPTRGFSTRARPSTRSNARCFRPRGWRRRCCRTRFRVGSRRCWRRATSAERARGCPLPLRGSRN